MSFISLRNLIAGNIVLGDDWQDIKNNFDYLNALPDFYQPITDEYLGASTGWDWLDNPALNFNIEAGGGPVLFFFGGILTGSDPANLAEISMKIGAAYPIQPCKRLGQVAAAYTDLSRCFTYPLNAGAYACGLLFKTTDANLEIINPYVGAWAL
jgi:hypothetical protein